MTKKRIVLGVSMGRISYHLAGWRHEDAPTDGIHQFSHYVRVAKAAEAAKFDMLFLADGLSMRTDDIPKGSLQGVETVLLDPLTLLPALSAVTSKIGLVATASTTYNEPYHIARKFATLDHISGGRAAWNVVTSFSDSEAQNFGLDASAGASSRYDRAREFLEVVEGLWSSFEDGAFVSDKTTGRYVDTQKMHPLNHKGKHFSVRGPMNLGRPPQGAPVLVMAGVSDEGLELMASKANVAYAATQTLSEAQSFYRSVKDRMGKYDRSPEELKVMPGILAVVGTSRQEAEDKFGRMQALIDPLVGLNVLCSVMGDLSAYPVDGPVPDLSDSAKGKGRLMLEHARKENLTIRQLYERVSASRGHWTVVGTAAEIADQMEEWVAAGGADGFNFLPLVLPTSLEEFGQYVVPELQRRGVFRSEYESSTLRGHLGVPCPRAVLR